ncbi:RagB/SusD family nutrient uptake outer membrane protein [Chitinophaga silvatica]|uniref:RagB/SusD family nutrient uptake outer membrane protein n=1 Tax=Chitinophaga silvatica TaxID=2282649 RepID=A0A3E1YBU2_9BACT|nr:RagB/SusD family nutrient uptake outer membrane protein [Chitinophaga silvatica]RFS23498.1 RagB/SusD family nutrient uptake outer membrane protein [Chitinophaga silvatica]
MIRNILKSTLVIAGCMAYSACSLKENLGSAITQQQADSLLTADQLLKAAYDDMQFAYQDFSQTFGLCEMSTDACVGPTRGADWDDGGVWRELHEHRWTSDNLRIQTAYTSLLLDQFDASNVLRFKPTPRVEAEARFLRVWSIFGTLDLFNQVAFRNPGDDLLKAPKVMQTQEAMDYIISELTAIMPNLPTRAATKAAYVATQDAAKFLMMKVYLNKGAFLNRKAPTFDAADMQKVISLADEITATGNYALANNYFDNFAYNNDVISTENIFTQQNGPGFSTSRAGNNVYCRWTCTLHYKQTPGGWNGFTTLSDFYNKFEDVDSRKGMAYQGVTNIGGLRVGFLIGQQYNEKGEKILDRNGLPLVFTPDITIRVNGDAVEAAGIRVVKYPPDMKGGGNDASNDFVFMRYADVLLMKAEALLRTNNAPAALTIVNGLRTKRGATIFADLTTDKLIDERGRELYWEGWRRQDLIRFGKYLDPWQLKQPDDPKYLLFPIPTSDLAVNPNLKQNPGY